MLAGLAFAVVVGIVRQPDVQKIHVVLRLGVIGNVICHDAPRGGVGHADVGVEGYPLERLPRAFRERQILEALRRQILGLRRFPAFQAADAKGFRRPAVPHIVQVQAAFLDFHFALPLPLQHGVGIDGFGLAAGA